MEFLKEILGDTLYAQVSEKLRGTDKVKLANLSSGEYVAKSKHEAAEKKIQDLQEQLTARDGQLEELNKTAGSNAELTGQIKELQTANAQAAKDWEAKLAATEREYALKDALKNEYRARDVLSVLPHLKQDGILFAEGKFTGLSEQMKELQKEKAFLFNDGNGAVPPGTGGAPSAGGETPPAGFNFGFAHIQGEPANKQ